MSTNFANTIEKTETHTEPGPFDTKFQPPTSPKDTKEPFYRQYISGIKIFRSGKVVQGAKPISKPPPKVLKSFTVLGKNLFGQPADIDDRQNIFLDGVRYMSSASKDSVEKLNLTAVGLLCSRQPRPTRNDFLTRPTQAPLEKYPIARRIAKPITVPLPDANAVFQRLLCGDGVDRHPNGMSSMTFAMASLISLSLVRINNAKPECSETSPLLDLSPLYGVNEEESNSIRVRDGRGMLSPDCFYEDRVSLLPPCVSVLLILWNRNHNYIARRLLLNNEKKGWVDPASSNDILRESLLPQDDEIFRIARAINCNHFKNVVSEDFLKVLIGLPNVGPCTNMNILVDLQQSEKGNGHDSSLEFNLLYNWSVLMGPADVEKIKESIKENSEQPFDALELVEFKEKFNSSRNHMNPNKRQRHYAGLERGLEGHFQDEDLARILLDATETPAGTPGARHISHSFRTAEIMVIEQARRQGVTSLNEFRKYLGLKPLKSFDEWNSNPDIARAAENLYGNINNLELYPGLLAEEVAPGSGLNFGYTMMNGLLVDLVTIIRSDPCFTTDLTPSELTLWGYSDCMPISNNGAFGAMLPRLLQRNLPRHCTYDNIYTLFPFTCPKDTRELLFESAGSEEYLEGMYDFERPKFHQITSVETKAAISYIFNNPNFRTIYENDLKTLTNGHGYFLGIEDKKRHDEDLMMTMFALIPDKGALDRYAAYFGTIATELILTQSEKVNGHKIVDIANIINTTSTRWVCETLCGLRLDDEKRSVDSDDGKRSVDMHDKLGALFAYVFRNIDPEKGWASRELALKTSRELRESIESALPDEVEEPDETYLDFIRSSVTSTFGLLSRIYREMQPQGIKLSQHSSQTFLDRMVKSAKNFPLTRTTPHGDAEPVDFITCEKQAAAFERSRSIANVLGLAVVISVNYAQTCVQAVDFYLNEQYNEERKEIIRLSKLSPVEARRQNANVKIMGYIREAQRLGQPLGLWREVLNNDIIPQANGLPSIPVKAGDRIFADFQRAHTNEQDFVKPFEVDPNRQTPSIQGMGLHKCPGLSFVDQTMPELFKAVFRLKNLRRERGKAGQLERFVPHPAPNRTDLTVFVDSMGEMSHFPRSLTLLYDGDELQYSVAQKLEKKSKWNEDYGSSTKKSGAFVDRAARLIVLLALAILLSLLMSVLKRPLSFRGPSYSTKLPQRKARFIPKAADVVIVHTDCPPPITPLHPFESTTFVPGPDGHPLPIVYNLNHTTAHMLKVIDIDAMDTRMSIYVDEELRGLTGDFVLNKTVNCGEDTKACLDSGFSAGMVIVPPGSHIVRIQWAGKEFVNGTTEMDWGKEPERVRRIHWSREYCS